VTLGGGVFAYVREPDMQRCAEAKPASSRASPSRRVMKLVYRGCDQFAVPRPRIWAAWTALPVTASPPRVDSGSRCRTPFVTAGSGCVAGFSQAPPILVAAPRCFTMRMKPMVLRFNERRATEAAARLLKLRGGRMSYLKLIKMLYFLDREALLRWGRPVTTDRYVSMDNGPVVSRIYDLIREEPAPGTDTVWRHYISAPQEWEVTLLAEPETDEISRAEEALIEEIFSKFGNMTRWDLVRVSHELPEWQDPNGSAIPIQYRDILRAGNKTESEIAAVEAELESLATTEAMLQPA